MRAVSLMHAAGESLICEFSDCTPLYFVGCIRGECFPARASRVADYSFQKTLFDGLLTKALKLCGRTLLLQKNQHASRRAS